MKLRINADDFGISPGVNSAIEKNPELKGNYNAIMKLLYQMQSMKGIQTRLPGEIIID